MDESLTYWYEVEVQRVIGPGHFGPEYTLEGTVSAVTPNAAYLALSHIIAEKKARIEFGVMYVMFNGGVLSPSPAIRIHKGGVQYEGAGTGQLLPRPAPVPAQQKDKAVTILKEAAWAENGVDAPASRPIIKSWKRKEA